jgi:hypothetical protein
MNTFYPTVILMMALLTALTMSASFVHDRVDPRSETASRIIRTGQALVYSLLGCLVIGVVGTLLDLLGILS